MRSMKEADIEAVVGIHLHSFPGFFLSQLGPRFLHLYYRGVCRDPDGVALVFEDDDGRPRGFVVGSINPRGFYSRLLRRSWVNFALAGLGATLVHPGAFLRLMRALKYPGQNPGGRNLAGLYSIAVDPSCQGQRIGASLIEAFKSDIDRRGARHIFLTTDRDGNDAVNQFYLRQGFSLKRQYLTPEGRWMNEYWSSLESK